MSDHLDAIMAVMDAAFDPAFGEAWSRRQVGDTLTLPNTHYLLANDRGEEPGADEEVAAFALTRAIAGEEELLLLAVVPRHRGKGVGARLLNRVVAEAQARGTGRLFLEMRDGNPAERLYRRHGFIVLGRRRHYYRRGTGDPVDAITFARDIETKA